VKQIAFLFSDFAGAINKAPKNDQVSKLNKKRFIFVKQLKDCQLHPLNKQTCHHLKKSLINLKNYNKTYLSFMFSSKLLST